MPASQLSDLLPIDEGNASPHPYQVFGLVGGEQDATAIATAVRATVQSLKSVKDQTDPKLWNQAAKLVQSAKAVLGDPEKKAELDARFGIVSVAESTDTASTDTASSDTVTSSPPSTDPLAGMLPPADPLAKLLPPVNPMASVASTDEASPMVSVPPSAANPVVSSAAATPPVSTPVIRKARPIRRRRRSILGTLVMGVLMLGMLALIGGGIYTLFYGLPSAIAITSREGEITIRTGDKAMGTPETQVSSPRESIREKDRKVDKVMGNYSRDADPPKTSPESDIQLTAPEAPPFAPEMGLAETANSPTPESPTTVSQAPDDKVSEEMVTQADTALRRVSDLIRSANWKQMKSAAEELIAMKMNGAQKAQAEGLYELADLATFYRGGIERGVAGLEATNDFMVSDDIRVIVVETGADKLIVQLNRKNREFTFDKLPLTLADRLASFSIPEGPTRDAARAAYQAIVPNTTPEHRLDSVQTLMQIENVEGSDPKRVANAIQSLFEN